MKCLCCRILCSDDVSQNSNWECQCRYEATILENFSITLKENELASFWPCKNSGRSFRTIHPGTGVSRPSRAGMSNMTQLYPEVSLHCVPFVTRCLIVCS